MAGIALRSSLFGLSTNKGEEASLDRDPLQMAMQQARDTYTPQHLKDSKFVSDRSGIGLDAILDSPSQEVTRQKNLYNLQEDRDFAPVTFDFQSRSRDNAIYTKEDKEPLSVGEYISRMGSSFLGNVVRTGGQTISGIKRIMAMTDRYYTPELASELDSIDLQTMRYQAPWWIKTDADMRKMIEKRQKSQRALGKVGEAVEEKGQDIIPENQMFHEEVFGALGQISAQMTMVLATGGIGGSLLLGAQGADIVGDEIDAEGMSDKEFAELAILLGGATTAIMEKYALDRLFKAIPKSTASRMMRFLKGAGTEASQEIMEGIGHNLVQLQLVDPNQNILESSLAHEGAVAGVAGGLVSMALPSRAKSPNVTDITKGNETLKQASDTFANAKMNEESPAELAELKTEVLDDTLPDRGVWISAERLVQFANENVKNTKVLKAIDPDQLRVALENGDDIFIPNDNIAKNVFGTESFNTLSNDFKYERGGQSVNDYMQALAQNAPDISETLKQEEDAQEGPSEAQIKEISKEQGVTPKEARTIATELAEAQSSARKKVIAFLDNIQGKEVEEVIELMQQLSDTPADFLTTLLKEGNFVRHGRAQALKQQAKILDKEIRLLHEKVLQDEAKNIVPSIELLDQMGEKQTQLDLIEAEAHQMLTNKERQVDNDEKLLLKKDTISSKVSGMSKKVVAAFKKDADTAREALVQMVEQSGLSRENKSKYLKTVKNMDSLDKLKREFFKVQARVSRDLERQQKGELEGKIKKFVKKNKAKTKPQSGKVTGKTTPEINKLLKEIDSIFSLKKEEAGGMLESNFIFDNFQEILGPLLTFKANRELVSVEELTQLTDNLEQLIKEGKAIQGARDAELEAQVKHARSVVMKAIGGKQGTRPADSNQNKQSVLNIVKNDLFLRLNGSWLSFQEVIYDQQSKDRSEAEVNKAREISEKAKRTVSTHEEAMAFQNMKDKAQKRLEALIEKHSEQSMRKMRKHIWNGNKKIDVIRNMPIKRTDQEGNIIEETIDLSMTRNEIRQRYMELQNPEVRKQIIGEDTAVGWPSELDGKIIDDWLADQLQDEDFAIIKALQEFYGEVYTKVNDVYRKMYYVDLGRRHAYVPIKREYTDTDADSVQSSALMQDLHTGEVGGSFLNNRTDAHRGIAFQNDIVAALGYIDQSMYFVTHAEKTRLIRKVFNDDVADVIRHNKGKDMVQIMNQHVDSFITRGRDSSNDIVRWVNFFIRNFRMVQLGLKIQIGVKQLTSFPAFMEDVAITDFLEGMKVFAQNPVAAWGYLEESSDFFRLRGKQHDPDIDYMKATADNTGFIRNFVNNPTLDKIQFFPIMLGDKGAIGIGGYAHIYAKRKAGMSEAEAIRSFEVLANRTQQSTSSEHLSFAQKSKNPFLRYLTMFKSSPIALTRANIEAMVMYKKGRITHEEFSKRMAIYNVVIPTFFAYISNALDWDDEDQGLALANGFAGMVGVYDILSVLSASMAKAIIEDSDIKIHPVTQHNPFEFANSIHRSIQKIADGDVSMDDFMDSFEEIDNDKFAEGLAETFGLLTGRPAETLLNELRGIWMMASGVDLENGWRLLAGYTPWTLEKREENQDSSF